MLRGTGGRGELSPRRQEGLRVLGEASFPSPPPPAPRPSLCHRNYAKQPEHQEGHTALAHTDPPDRPAACRRRAGAPRGCVYAVVRLQLAAV